MILNVKISKPKCDVMYEVSRYMLYEVSRYVLYEVSRYMLFNVYEICVTLRVSNITDTNQNVQGRLD